MKSRRTAHTHTLTKLNQIKNPKPIAEKWNNIYRLGLDVIERETEQFRNIHPFLYHYEGRRYLVCIFIKTPNEKLKYLTTIITALNHKRIYNYTKKGKQNVICIRKIRKDLDTFINFLSFFVGNNINVSFSWRSNTVNRHFMLTPNTVNELSLLVCFSLESDFWFSFQFFFLDGNQ